VTIAYLNSEAALHSVARCAEWRETLNDFRGQVEQRLRSLNDIRGHLPPRADITSSAAYITVSKSNHEITRLVRRQCRRGQLEITEFRGTYRRNSTMSAAAAVRTWLLLSHLA